MAAEARDLGDALDALIGNVFSHTDEGIAFRVAVGMSDGSIAWLEVSDDGGGMLSSHVVETRPVRLGLHRAWPRHRPAAG